VVCAKFGEDRWRIADAIVVQTYKQTYKHTDGETHLRRWSYYLPLFAILAYVVDKYKHDTCAASDFYD
jgi:hypothetical protein